MKHVFKVTSSSDDWLNFYITSVNYDKTYDHPMQQHKFTQF